MYRRRLTEVGVPTLPPDEHYLVVEFFVDMLLRGVILYVYVIILSHVPYANEISFIKTNLTMQHHLLIRISIVDG